MRRREFLGLVAERRYRGRRPVRHSRRLCPWSDFLTAHPLMGTRRWRPRSDWALKRPAMSRVRTSRSNTAGRTIRTIACQHLRRLGQPSRDRDFSRMAFDCRDREAHAHAVGLRRVEGFKETRQALRAQPMAGIRTATHTPSGSILTVLMCNSRLPSSTPLIDWMALTIKFNITCCSCTRSHWMRGNSPASCVPP